MARLRSASVLVFAKLSVDGGDFGSLGDDELPAISAADLAFSAGFGVGGGVAPTAFSESGDSSASVGFRELADLIVSVDFSELVDFGGAAGGRGGGASPGMAAVDGIGGGSVPLAISALRVADCADSKEGSLASFADVEAVARRAPRLGGRAAPSVPVAAKSVSLSSDIFLS